MSVTGILWAIVAALALGSLALIVGPGLFGYSSPKHRDWGFSGGAAAIALGAFLVFTTCV